MINREAMKLHRIYSPLLPTLLQIIV